MSSTSEQSPQTKAIMAWAQGFIDSDVDQIAAALHPDYIHDTFPRSLKIPQQNKEQWIQSYKKIKDVLKNFKVDIHSMTEVPGKVFIHATDYADTTVGVPFVNEATLIVEVAPNGDGELKVKHVEEFLDSQFTLEFMKAVQASRDS
ncbi:hypothetical protein BDM02DRAFT_3120200 [Thelephora ganbajun]|uniref:Uncharacterized protein n=1 Tax=Thelephora ganbajun TaxID=370292 RepID=A0ACB6Z6U8_THEGA|nr:hypothetical protein BDM02DRAFT_3120200 [Thelephora ganbajun]